MSSLAAMGHNNPPSEIEILQERLNSHTDLHDTLQRLLSKPIPAEIQGEEEAGAATDYIKALKILRSDVEVVFTREKKPFWDACKTADEWKNGFWKKIDRQIDDVSKPVIAFNKKKEEAERQRQLELARKAREEADKLAAEAAAHEEVGIVDTAQELMDMAVQEEQKADMITGNAIHGVTGKSRGDFSSSSNRKPWTGVLESRPALDMEALRNYFSEDAIDKAIKAAVRDGVRNIRGVRIFQDEKLTVR